MNQHFKPVAVAPALQDFANLIVDAENLQARLIQMLADRERQFAIETTHLRERINELEELLGLKEMPDVPPIPIIGCRALRKITPIIKLLAARDLVSKLAISLAIGGDALADETIRVYLYHASASLRAIGMKVHNDRGRGWYLKQNDRDKLRKLLSKQAGSRS